MEGTRPYRIWTGMKSRCFNTNHEKYNDYGGRGVTVCQEWKNSFADFYSWATENGYKDDLAIDRIDNDGSYEPSNCRWVSWRENNSNRRNNNEYVGVGWNQPSKAYQARIRIDGRQRSLGYFRCPVMASAAYQMAKELLDD